MNGVQQLNKAIAIGSSAGVNQVQTAATLAPGGINVTSADGEVTVIANNIDYLGILKIKAQNIPDGWVAITDPYSLTPDSLVFSPAANISFKIPAKTGSNDYAYFIAQYANGQWNVVPERTSAGCNHGEDNYRRHLCPHGTRGGKYHRSNAGTDNCGEPDNGGC